jgi:myo-inositol 2-dehydrogenase/D-chiro-inositol 1-dehydrogenase
MPLRLAVLGAGRIGRVHARAIAATADARLVAVTDPVAEAAQNVASAFGCAVRELDEIVKDEDIDAVVICTPTDTHADLIERFSRAGKAIFCEKPVDLDVARAEACAKVVEETGAKVMLGFNRRFDPHFQAVHKAIEDGRIGKVEMVTITSRDPGPPPAEYIKVSGGIFRDMTIHDLDVARWLLGEEPVEVTAVGSRLVDPSLEQYGDFDTVMVQLKTATGKQCHINNCREAVYGYDQRIEVFGSTGMVLQDNLRPTTIRRWSSTATDAREPLLNFFLQRYQQAYKSELDAFVDALVDGRELPTSVHDGLKALRLAECALESANTGRTVTV